MHAVGFFITKKVTSKFMDKEEEWPYKINEFFRQIVYEMFEKGNFIDSRNSSVIGGRWSGILNKVTKRPILKDETYYRPAFNFHMNKKADKFPDWRKKWEAMSQEEQDKYRIEYIQKSIGFRDTTRKFGYCDDVQKIDKQILEGLDTYFAHEEENFEKATSSLDFPKVWLQDMGEIPWEVLTKARNYVGHIITVIDYRLDF